SPGAGYFLSEDQRLLFILAEPETERGSFTGDQRAIEGVRAVIASLKRDFPEVQVGVTGKPALQNDEMVAAFRDSQRATIIAFALTLGLLLVAFLRVGKPLLMLLVLAASLCWSIGVATLVIGHLSLFSVMFVMVDRRHATRPAGAIPRALALERIHVPFVSQLVAYPKTVALLAVALTVVSAWGLRYVQFDYNLLNLQGVGTESVIWEKRILATAGRSGFTALASAESLDELQRKQAAFRALA